MTNLSHNQKSLDATIKDWSTKLNCPEYLLRYCINKVGNSYTAVEAFWSMNKTWLEENYKRSNSKPPECD